MLTDRRKYLSVKEERDLTEKLTNFNVALTKRREKLNLKLKSLVEEL